MRRAPGILAWVGFAAVVLAGAATLQCTSGAYDGSYDGGPSGTNPLNNGCPNGNCNNTCPSGNCNNPCPNGNCTGAPDANPGGAVCHQNDQQSPECGGEWCINGICRKPCTSDNQCNLGSRCIRLSNGGIPAGGACVDQSGYQCTGSPTCGGQANCPNGTYCVNGECRTVCNSGGGSSPPNWPGCNADQVCEPDPSCGCNNCTGGLCGTCPGECYGTVPGYDDHTVRPGADAGHGGPGGPGFCASRPPGDAACVDFDEGGGFPPAGWTTNQASGGAVVLDQKNSLSPPFSLLATTPAGNPGTPVYDASIVRQFGPLGNGLHATFSMRVDNCSVSGAGYVSVFGVQPSQSSILALVYDTLGGRFSFVQQHAEPDGGVADDESPLPTSPPMGGAWTTIDLDAKIPNGPITIAFNGANVFSALSQPITRDGTPLGVAVGLQAQGQTNPCTVHYDNVVIDLYP